MRCGPCTLKTSSQYVVRRTDTQKTIRHLWHLGSPGSNWIKHFSSTRFYPQRAACYTYQRIPKKVTENTEERDPDC